MILIIDCGYKGIQRLSSAIDEFMDVKIIPIYDFSETDLSAVDGVILSSGQFSVNESHVDNYLERLEPLKSTVLPVLGIGIGHHLIGLLFGAFPSYQPYTNDYVAISIFSESLLFDRLPLDIEVMVDHAGTISIPPSFKLSASSDHSINEGMEHESRPVFGIQFLPENSGNHGSIILENFTKIALQQREGN